jgi:hypothetical protein
VDVIVVPGLLTIATERVALDLGAVAIAGHRDIEVDLMPVWMGMPCIVFLAEVIGVALVRTLIVVPVKLCLGAVAPLTAVATGRRAGTEDAIPGREEDIILVPTPGATIGTHETTIVAGGDRVGRTTVILVEKRGTICLAATFFAFGLALG